MSDGSSVQERTPRLPWLRVNERGELALSPPDEAVADSARGEVREDGVPVEAEIDEEVGNKKWIVAKAKLYRDGLLVTDTDCSSGHPTEALRGQVFVVCVDDKGRAHWVSSVYHLPTACSKLDQGGIELAIQACGFASAVRGGRNRTAGGDFDWVAGRLVEDG